MECTHNMISITPTTDTVWNLDNRYNVICTICKKQLYEEITDKELKKVIYNNNYTIISGEKYL